MPFRKDPFGRFLFRTDDKDFGSAADRPKDDGTALWRAREHEIPALILSLETRGLENLT
jgi:hypothetical protein